MPEPEGQRLKYYIREGRNLSKDWAMMSAAWVVGGDQMRHEQEGSRHRTWHGYSFVRAMNSAYKASLAAAGTRATLYPTFLPPFRFFIPGTCILCIEPDPYTVGWGAN